MEALAERTTYSTDYAEADNSPQTFEDALVVIRDQQQVIEQLTEQLRYDELSGLLTKAAWHEDVDQRIEKDKPFGIFVLDLNNFKQINDDFSHHQGDILIEKFGNLLNERFRRETDQLAFISHDEDSIFRSRIGGDEFAISIDLSDNERRGDNIHARMDQVYEYIEQIWDEFISQQDPEFEEKGLGLAIGPAIWSPHNPVDGTTLYRQADEAMYESKPLTEEEALEEARMLGSAALQE